MATNVPGAIFPAETSFDGFDRAGIKRQHLRPYGRGLGHIGHAAVIHDVIAQIRNVEFVFRPCVADTLSEREAAVSLQYPEHGAPGMRDRLPLPLETDDQDARLGVAAGLEPVLHPILNPAAEPLAGRLHIESE